MSKITRVPLWYRRQELRHWFIGSYYPGGDCRVYKPRSLGYLVARFVHIIRHGV